MADKKPEPNGFQLPQAAELSRAMFEAHQLLHEAHINYNQALAMARDTELSSDGMSALQQKGRMYAEAVTRYSNAVMAWLALVDAHKEQAILSLRKAAGK